MEYIRLATKEDFKKAMKTYDKKWRLYMWELFKKNTCYVPSEDYFISLEKAEKLGFKKLEIVENKME